MPQKISILFVTLALALSVRPLYAADAQKLSYNRDIRPILSANCFACHGFDVNAREADLRLDVAEAAFEDRGGYQAIVAGKPGESEAWKRIASEDDSERMPPPDSHKVLKPEEKEKIRRWIEEGAEYAKHWSFIPPRKAELPAVSNAAWPKNEIDRFVLAKLDEEKLKPSAEADRRMLIRRVTLDLTGLPPSAEEIEAFVNDKSENVYEKLVDRLLASPAFGERMALDWLDSARYADTNGFSIDGGRHIWLWRDWVINAFNQNKPYDKFLIEQLAGDLIPDNTPAQLIATGFQRNNMVTHEGGTIAAENLANYNADRVKTLGEAVLGLTLGCAQCHDHKYDPLTQREYYQLFAYFNTLADKGLDGNGGVSPLPSVTAKTVLETGEEPDLKKEIAALKEKLANVDAAALDRWEEAQRKALAARGREFKLHPVELLKVSTPNAGSGFDIEENQVRIARGGDIVPYDVSLKLPEMSEPITGLRVVFHPDEKAKGGRGYGKPDAVGAEGDKTTFVLTTFTTSAGAVPSDQVNLNAMLHYRHITASDWLPKYRPEYVRNTLGLNGWSPSSTEGTTHITLTFEEPVNVEDTPYLTTQLNFGYGKFLVAARYEIFAMTGADDGSDLPPEIIATIEKAKSDRSDDEQKQLRDYFATYSAEMAPTRIALENLEERLTVLTQEFSTMVMNIAEKPRDTFILNRGDYSQPGEKVENGVPEVLPAMPEDAPANRLGLAQWVTMRDHPLTARVAVNRVWQILFGAGIVRTPADLGAQGEWPTHPDLLDWLAVDFVEGGWDVKALVKKIVTSATYRQNSAATKQLLERDPQNRLLARGPRFRLPAELIRDAALKTSGLLVSRIGGPSVNPYTPGDLWREVSHYGSSPATAQTFVQDHGEKLYRRSMYTYWKRTAPPPNLSAFDAPNREVCVVARPSTTTPLQALVLLNDVQFVEAARAFAERILHRDGDDASRLRWAFEEALSRAPTEEEFAVLSAALKREREQYAGDEVRAKEYLSAGESPRDKNISAPEHAAWSQIAAMLFNTSEFVTRN